MKRQHMRLAAAAAILAVIGLLSAGVSASTLFLLAIVVSCPLMMVFMHGGHGDNDQKRPQHTGREEHRHH